MIQSFTRTAVEGISYNFQAQPRVASCITNGRLSVSFSPGTQTHSCKNDGMQAAEIKPVAALPSRRSVILLQAALGVAILMAARLAWLLSHAEKLDTPAQLPALIWCELPWLVGLWALFSGDAQKRAARGAGIAFGAAVGFCFLSVPLYLMLGLKIWDNRNPHSSLVMLESFLPVCLIVCLGVVAAAWLCGKGNRGTFAKAAGIGLAVFVVAFFLIGASQVRGSGEAKEKAVYVQPAMSAEYQLRMVAACLIRHRYLYPEDGFPGSLAAISADWNCEAGANDPWALPGYWIYYSAVDRGKDFRLEAIPTEQARNFQQVSTSDGRGEVLKFYGLNASAEQIKNANIHGHFAVQTVDADSLYYYALRMVRGAVENYMSAHDLANAPPSLDGVFDMAQLRRACEDDEKGAKEREIKTHAKGPCFTVGYSPNPGTPANTFSIAMTCVSYGTGCIRSYFLDFDGKVHATAEPRPATAEDPGLLPCETIQVCNDDVWTQRLQPSDWMFFRAGALSAIHSTNWW